VTTTETEHQERPHGVPCPCGRETFEHDARCSDACRATFGRTGHLARVERPTRAMRAFNGARPDCESCGGLGRHNGVDCICRRYGR